MDNIYILKEIVKFDNKVWKLFSLLNKEMNEYFCIKGYEYELNFRTIDKDEGLTCYLLDGLLHRSDGPAVIWKDDSKEWYFNGKLHRLDGPAIIYSNGGESWWVNGKLHRIDGPAVEYVKEDMKINNRWFVDEKLILKESEKL